MSSPYSGSPHNPYHLSIGAVLQNEEGLIACHHFDSQYRLPDIYLLMRETMERDESPEQTVLRGLQEEFGATARVERYLGSLVQPYDIDGTKVQKTTLYFLCSLISIDEAGRKADDEEKDSTICWKSAAFLREAQTAQAARLGMADIDESEIIERL